MGAVRHLWQGIPAVVLLAACSSTGTVQRTRATAVPAGTTAATAATTPGTPTAATPAGTASAAAAGCRATAVTSIAVEGGSTAYVICGTTLDRTTDDGKTFQTVTALPDNAEQVAIIDPTHLRVLGSDTLLGTDDGRTWWREPQTTPQLTDFSFADTRGGLAANDSGGLDRTTDGGHTWRPIAAPAGVTVASAHAAGGWIGTQDGVFHSVDGNAWTRIATGPTSQLSNEVLPVSDIQAAGATAAYVEYDEGQGAASQRAHATTRVTAAGTQTYLDAGPYLPTLIHDKRLGDYPGPISAIDATTVAIAAASPARPSLTVEVAPSGSPHAVPGAVKALAMAFSSATDGWLSVQDALDPNTRLLHTTDGGAHWAAVVLPA